MGRVWVLDTETKGTGAHVVPLEDVLAKPAPKREPKRFRRKLSPEPHQTPDPTNAPALAQPRKFKVVDVMTGLVIAEGCDVRETVQVLRKFRSVVDVDILVWDRPFEKWRRLNMPDKRRLWGFRDLTDRA